MIDRVRGAAGEFNDTRNEIDVARGSRVRAPVLRTTVPLLPHAGDRAARVACAQVGGQGGRTLVEPEDYGGATEGGWRQRWQEEGRWDPSGGERANERESERTR